MPRDPRPPRFFFNELSASHDATALRWKTYRPTFRAQQRRSRKSSGGPVDRTFREPGQRSFVTTVPPSPAGCAAMSRPTRRASFEDGDRIDGRGGNDGGDPHRTDREADPGTDPRPGSVAEAAEEATEAKHDRNHDREEQRGGCAPGQCSADGIAVHEVSVSGIRGDVSATTAGPEEQRDTQRLSAGMTRRVKHVREGRETGGSRRPAVARPSQIAVDRHSRPSPPVKRRMPSPARGTRRPNPV